MKYHASKLIIRDFLCNGMERPESDLGICMMVPYKRYMKTTFVIGISAFSTLQTFSLSIFLLKTTLYLFPSLIFFSSGTSRLVGVIKWLGKSA